MAVAKTLPLWKPLRPKPELQPATDEQAREYMSWFVNRRAYTRQRDKPNPESGKYFFYQARNFETKERLALRYAKREPEAPVGSLERCPNCGCRSLVLRLAAPAQYAPVTPEPALPVFVGKGHSFLSTLHLIGPDANVNLQQTV